MPATIMTFKLRIDPLINKDYVSREIHKFKRLIEGLSSSIEISTSEAAPTVTSVQVAPPEKDEPTQHDSTTSACRDAVLACLAAARTPQSTPAMFKSIKPKPSKGTMGRVIQDLIVEQQIYCVNPDIGRGGIRYYQNTVPTEEEKARWGGTVLERGMNSVMSIMKANPDVMYTAVTLARMLPSGDTAHTPRRIREALLELSRDGSIHVLNPHVGTIDRYFSVNTQPPEKINTVQVQGVKGRARQIILEVLAQQPTATYKDYIPKSTQEGIKASALRSATYHLIHVTGQVETVNPCSTRPVFRLATPTKEE